MDKPVSSLTRLAIQQHLILQGNAAQELVRAAAEAEQITLDGKTRLDFQRMVWVVSEPQAEQP